MSRRFVGRRRRLGIQLGVGFVALAVAACANGAGATTTSTGFAPVVTGSPGPPSSIPSVAASASAGPASLPIYAGGDYPISPGEHVTGGDGFFPGLVLTIPPGWAASETDAGELSLHQADRSADSLLLWKDMSAVVTNNRSGTVGKPLANVGSSTAEILRWLTTTTDFAILAKPKSATIGGVQGIVLTLTTSKTANFDWTDCPDNPHCTAIFTNTAHWGSNFFAIGGDEVARIFVADLPYPGIKHTFYVVLDAVDPASLATLATEAQPIIDSLQLPTSFLPN